MGLSQPGIGPRTFLPYMPQSLKGEHAREVASGERFEFGANWSNFLAKLNDQRLAVAARSLVDYLGEQGLAEKSFLDVGCGSGIFSLTARQLGARVFSFDYDPNSVGCAEALKARFFADDPNWRIQQGSVLDREYLSGLGQFDIVYSWGVLHHTGAMWDALGNVAPLVKPGGRLFISIYNDQGGPSRRWLAVKRAYNRLPDGLRWLVLWPSAAQLWWKPMLKDLLTLRPFAQWRQYARARGMSPWHDLVDWVGGYPFEVATPEQIFNFYRDRGFVLEKLATCGGSLGCNQFLFRRS